MVERPAHSLTERDLRALSTAELLALIQKDIRDLDSVWRERHKDGKIRKTDPAQPPGLQDREEPVTLHRIICCSAHLGDFLPIARVRCPFCETWHRAADFPLQV